MNLMLLNLSMASGAALLAVYPANATQSGSVAAWGRQVMPVVQPDTRFIAIAAGGVHSLALKTDRTVVAWGNNSCDQNNVPAGLSVVVAIASGDEHSLALKADGTVVAWGAKCSGQSTVPSGLSGVAAIAAGGHSLALKTDGTVVAWGSNETNVPSGLSGVVAIAAGYHSLALKTDGTLVAWGDNRFGQSTVPSGLSGVVAIAAGAYHNLALKSDGTVVAWGSNFYGETNVPSSLSGIVAVAARGFHNLALKADGTVVAWGQNHSGQSSVPSGLSGVVAVAAGGARSLALKSDGTIVAWGDNHAGMSTVPGKLSGLVAVAAGWEHNLALRSDKTVVAWGRNDYGESTVPNGLSGVVAVAAGSAHSLALKSDGTVAAWGGDFYGQTNVPSGLGGVVAVAGGGGHSLALKSDGTLVAWGENSYGQSTVPTGLSSVVAIAARGGFNLALKSDGTVVAWGDNGSGQTNMPSGLSGVVAIAAGEQHSLALKSDRTVVAWGANWSGQSTVPSGLSGVVAVAAGGAHSLALKPDGTVVAWGNDGYGQSTVPSGLDGIIMIAAGEFYSLALVASPGDIQGPVITSQPASRFEQTGASVSFTVSAVGASPMNYQWRYSPRSILAGPTSWQDIPGATGATLTRNLVTSTEAGFYSVRLWNAHGSVSSDAAQLTISQPLILTETSLTPTTAESTPAILCPISPSQLRVFVNGGFTTVGTLDSSKMTVVLSHGWRPSVGPVAITEGINGWPLDFADVLTGNGVGANANIVAWDWGCAAQSFACDPSKATGNTPSQGTGLAQALSAALGANYSRQIHFIGHSLGTLVNAQAANYLHGVGFDWSRTQMTLFDEASIATFTECPQMLWLAAVGNPSSSRNYLEPLPTKFAWADNYVSLVGNLHPEAANVILTEGLPTRASGILDLIDQAADFHSYPSTWYQETIETDISTMGHRWSFERGGFPGAPTPGTVFRQASSGSEWDLAQTTYDDGADMLESRWQTYHRAVITTAAQTIGAGLRGGNVFGLSIYGAPIDVNMVLHLITSFSGGDSPEPAPHPLGGDVSGAGGSYIPAYAWIPVTVPSNAVSMSFDFLLEGYGQNDSFAAALDGTNVLSVELSLLKTNVALNSGLIDVSSYAGQQVEFFLGIVGGTSTNASVTVSNFQFYVSAPPTLQVKFAGTNFLVSWPLPALDFILQTSTNLADSNSWVTLTNIPAIVNFQNTITNPITGGASFFRLRK